MPYIMYQVLYIMSYTEKKQFHMATSRNVLIWFCVTKDFYYKVSICYTQFRLLDWGETTVLQLFIIPKNSIEICKSKICCEMLVVFFLATGL